MNTAGNQRAETGKSTPACQRQQRSYQFRIGQVQAILMISSEVTTCDIAREIGISRRQAFNICRRMHEEGRISARQVPHAQHFKWLISRAA